MILSEAFCFFRGKIETLRELKAANGGQTSLVNLTQLSTWRVFSLSSSLRLCLYVWRVQCAGYLLFKINEFQKRKKEEDDRLLISVWYTKETANNWKFFKLIENFPFLFFFLRVSSNAIVKYEVNPNLLWLDYIIIY